MTWRVVVAGHYTQVKIWDLRMYKEVHAYFSAVPAVHVDISQRGMLAVGYGGHVQVWDQAGGLLRTSNRPISVYRFPPAPSADALPANLHGRSTWRPLSRAER
jgi:hypothetical protein